jgi:hypothetical protein
MMLVNIVFGVMAAFLVLFIYGMHLSNKDKKPA